MFVFYTCIVSRMCVHLFVFQPVIRHVQPFVLVEDLKDVRSVKLDGCGMMKLDAKVIIKKSSRY